MPRKNAENRGSDGRGEFSTTNDMNDTNEGEGGLGDLKFERREKLSVVSCQGSGVRGRGAGGDCARFVRGSCEVRARFVRGSCEVRARFVRGSCEVSCEVSCEECQAQQG